MAKKEEVLEDLEKVSIPVEDFIYGFYPPRKQSQDLMWSNSYQTKLTAFGEKEIEKKVVTGARSFFGGSKLTEILAAYDVKVKTYYEKLIKIAIRTEWAELCVKEGLTAIEEGREPVYQEFPDL